MQLFIGADHRGFSLKEYLKPWLSSLGYKVVDCGNTKLEPADDFPDFAFAVADAVTAYPLSRGIVICGSAGGITIAANKVKGILAAAAISAEDVVFNREHDDINVLCISGDNTPDDLARQMVTAFLTTPFSTAPRHQRRLDKIRERE